MVAVHDEERGHRIKNAMMADDLDYLVLRLPENILYTTGYWPLFGASAAVVSREGDDAIVFMDGEQSLVARSWVEDVRPYQFLRLDRFINLDQEFAALLGDLWPEKGYNPKVSIGYEGSFDVVAANNIGAEVRVPGPTWHRLLQEQFPDAKLVDATGTLRRARMIKSRVEIDNILVSCELAGMGYQAARELVAPGVKDAEIAAAVESTIYSRGVGYEGVLRARGFCSVLSGSKSAMGDSPYFVSSNRRPAEGDLMVIELLTHAEGYFCDLTRTVAVGEPSQQAQDLWGAVNEAMEAMLAEVAPGARAADVFWAGKRAIDRHGYGHSFIHNPGHGLGLQFHEPPTIHPHSTEILAAGMTLALEPHLYLPGWGGVRLEQTVAVTEDGCRLLSLHPLHL